MRKPTQHLVLASTTLAAALFAGPAFAQTRVRAPAMTQGDPSEARCAATDVEASVARRMGIAPAEQVLLESGRRGYTPVVDQDPVTAGRRAQTPVQEQGATPSRAGAPAVEQSGARRGRTLAQEQCPVWQAPTRARAQVPSQEPYGTTVQPLLVDDGYYEYAIVTADPSQVPGFWWTYSCDQAVFATDDGRVDSVYGWLDWETFSCVYVNVYYAW